jgi:hypothetical protein
MYVFGDLIDGRTLPALGESVRSAFQGLAAQVQTSWFKQHDRHGAHANVTAASLVLSGLLQANGRINVGTPVHVNRPLEAETKPFYLGAGGRGAEAALASFVRITTSSLDPSPLLWHGLDATGRAYGDVIFLVNDGNEVVEFVPDSASAPVGTRLIGLTGASGNIELHSAQLGLGIYSKNQFLGGDYWHLLCLT